MTAKLCQVAFGDPTKDGATPTPQAKLSMVRTMASWRGSYDSFASRYPNIHLSETIQLGEVIADPRDDEDPTTLRNKVSRMVEVHGLHRVTLDDMRYAPWAWGMDAVSLRSDGHLDRYLHDVGYVIGSHAASIDEPIQSVSLDTCAWTIEEKYRFLGGSARTIEDRRAWIDDRLQAFIDGYCAGGARIPLMVNGGRGAMDKGLIARTIDTGVYYEAFGLNNYSMRFGGRTPYDAILRQLNEVFEYLDNRPRTNAAVVLNPVPFNWQRDEMVPFLRGCALLYKVIERKANARRVPLYWHTDRTDGVGSNQPVTVDVTSFPAVWDMILEERWDTVTANRLPEDFVSLRRRIGDGKYRTLRAVIDDIDGFAIVREEE